MKTDLAFGRPDWIPTMRSDQAPVPYRTLHRFCVERAGYREAHAKVEKEISRAA